VLWSLQTDSRWTRHDDDDDVTLYVENCASNYLTVWMVAVYVYKGLLLVHQPTNHNNITRHDSSTSADVIVAFQHNETLLFQLSLSR